MGRRIDVVKEHLTKYKWYYISAGLVVGTAGVTYLIARGSHGSTMESDPISPNIGHALTDVPKPENSQVLTFSNIAGSNFDVTQIIESNRKGPPSWVIRCVETGELYSSQRKAAAELGLAELSLSRHLNGLLDHVDDLHFERICIAA